MDPARDDCPASLGISHLSATGNHIAVGLGKRRLCVFDRVPPAKQLSPDGQRLLDRFVWLGENAYFPSVLALRTETDIAALHFVRDPVPDSSSSSSSYPPPARLAAPRLALLRESFGSSDSSGARGPETKRTHADIQRLLLIVVHTSGKVRIWRWADTVHVWKLLKITSLPTTPEVIPRGHVTTTAVCGGGVHGSVLCWVESSDGCSVGDTDTEQPRSADSKLPADSHQKRRRQGRRVLGCHVQALLTASKASLRGSAAAIFVAEKEASTVLQMCAGCEGLVVYGKRSRKTGRKFGDKAQNSNSFAYFWSPQHARLSRVPSPSVVASADLRDKRHNDAADALHYCTFLYRHNSRKFIAIDSKARVHTFVAGSLSARHTLARTRHAPLSSTGGGVTCRVYGSGSKGAADAAQPSTRDFALVANGCLLVTGRVGGAPSTEAKSSGGVTVATPATAGPMRAVASLYLIDGGFLLDSRPLAQALTMLPGSTRGSPVGPGLVSVSCGHRRGQVRPDESEQGSLAGSVLLWSRDGVWVSQAPTARFMVEHVLGSRAPDKARWGAARRIVDAMQGNNDTQSRPRAMPETTRGAAEAVVASSRAVSEPDAELSAGARLCLLFGVESQQRESKNGKPNGASDNGILLDPDGDTYSRLASRLLVPPTPAAAVAPQVSTDTKSKKEHDVPSLLRKYYELHAAMHAPLGSNADSINKTGGTVAAGRVADGVLWPTPASPARGATSLQATRLRRILTRLALPTPVGQEPKVATDAELETLLTLAGIPELRQGMLDEDLMVRPSAILKVTSLEVASTRGSPGSVGYPYYDGLVRWFDARCPRLLSPFVRLVAANFAFPSVDGDFNKSGGPSGGGAGIVSNAVLRRHEQRSSAGAGHTRSSAPPPATTKRPSATDDRKNKKSAVRQRKAMKLLARLTDPGSPPATGAAGPGPKQPSPPSPRPSVYIPEVPDATPRRNSVETPPAPGSLPPPRPDRVCVERVVSRNSFARHALVCLPGLGPVQPDASAAARLHHAMRLQARCLVAMCDPVSPNLPRAVSFCLRAGRPDVGLSTSRLFLAEVPTAAATSSSGASGARRRRGAGASAVAAGVARAGVSPLDVFAAAVGAKRTSPSASGMKKSKSATDLTGRQSPISPVSPSRATDDIKKHPGPALGCAPDAMTMQDPEVALLVATRAALRDADIRATRVEIFHMLLSHWLQRGRGPVGNPVGAATLRGIWALRPDRYPVESLLAAAKAAAGGAPDVEEGVPAPARANPGPNAPITIGELRPLLKDALAAARVRVARRAKAVKRLMSEAANKDADAAAAQAIAHTRRFTGGLSGVAAAAARRSTPAGEAKGASGALAAFARAAAGATARARTDPLSALEPTLYA